MENDNALRELILKAALLNALQHSGKAQAGALMGRVIGERQDLKTKAKELAGLIGKIVNEINSLSVEEQKRRVEEKWPEALKKEKTEEKDKQLPALPNVDKYKQVVTRFSPNPDCVLHLGSARAIILSHEYARLYKGKFILRFEDTDPKVKKPVLEFYNRIREDLDWLGCKADEEYIQSDRLPIYYKYAEQLLREGNAYVCTCPPEHFREKSLAKEPCDCRKQSAEENIKRWQRMLDGGYGEGEAVVRIKTDIEHPNPAVRDWPALRIIDPEKYPHPRVGSKYRVWPLYNIAAGVDDYLLGVTHIIRGKEHLTNQVRQEYMYKHLGWKYPETIHYGRLKITGAFLSKSKIVQGIREGVYTGWDDPRLATFAALRKRGITPEAVKKMIIDVGPKTADVTLSWENLYAYNRKILDPESARYFFVSEPTKLKVKAVPKVFTAKLPLHPEKPEMGFREYNVTPEAEAAVFWIAKRDADAAEPGKMLRFMELFNVKIESLCADFVEAMFASEAYEDARKAKAKLIHWILEGTEVPCRVVMPDASVNDGVAESACKKLKPDDVIQFERFGFVRVDENDAELTVYYAHK
ncbi:glutamate--tRNA ligase [Candidatus Bathyarchaeota archaeon]|nr:glutamate--tRNA ligase [Candidatus Bathyarchaeota archaeon]